MSTRRLSTVHDLASLRLHPDGTRVQNSDKNLRIRASKYAARDSKGNWFARDAGGTGQVKQRWAKPRDEDEDEEEEDSTGADDDEQQSQTKSKGKQRAKDDNEEHLKDYRARKRRRYYADESFIAPTTPGAPPTQGSPKASSSRLTEEDASGSWILPTPSAETLKCMHYFACNYYTAMGQLRDSTKGARRSRKARRKQKSQQGEDGERSSEPSGEPTDRENSTEEETSQSSDSEDEEEEDDDEDSYKPRAHRRRERRASPDMYKALDGSALMAISMFVQEHIAQLLSADVPEEWDAEMEAERGAQRSKQAALNSVLASRHGRPSFKVRRRNTAANQDSDAEQPAKEKDTEAPGRRITRGVVLPKVTIPFADDSSEDEDYVP
ncbi:hypothetical protein DAEQUDRAFT_756445 [Daedalea quercina L-15889]|uniref:Uncharacterized protein n=1 Tax=Daedalea quercina L-15889 TaxID=1314783 RepID=A0A165R4A2_9APHY|nr:hypothetical protein DAEQUDRAFT_756445 [Daedalea quercina L-15889]